MGAEVVSLGKQSQIVVTPVVSASAAYTANDQVGGIMILSAAMGDLLDNSAILQSVSVVDSDSQKAAITVFFFDSLPVLTSVDNGAFALSAANMQKCLCSVRLPAASYDSSAAQSICTVGNIGMAVKCNEKTTDQVAVTGALYAVAMTTGTPTYTTTAGLQFRFSFQQ